jgi:aminoglycoside phosphotransferase family enzyme/predicted kinase
VSPAELLRGLADPRTYGAPAGTQVGAHETHSSWVHVCADRAYKVKKPVALGFLDYSTLALRRAACREEVRINRELAPDIYLGVRALVASAEGLRLAHEDAPAAVEYAVEMRAFAAEDTLAGTIAAGGPAPGRLAAVASVLAGFHARAPAASGGSPAELLEGWRENLAELEHAAAGLAAERLPSDCDGFACAFLAAHQREIQCRRAAGLVRDGHGDLRCEHVLLAPEVQIVDRIEFDPGLRRGDVACDIAFLAMDMEALGAAAAVGDLLAAYRRAGGDPGSRQLLRFHAAHRALVRVKVALLAASQLNGRERERELSRAQRLLRLAEELCWRARAPLALVVCGPAASGKSTLAAALAAASGYPVLSSDRVRKASAGLPPEARGGEEIYTEARTRETYAELAARAEVLLHAESGVILDATFRVRERRTALLARIDPARCLFVRCRVPEVVAVERARLRASSRDRVSDAGPALAAEHQITFEELEELAPLQVLDLDATAAPAAQLAAVRQAADRVLSLSATRSEAGP